MWFSMRSLNLQILIFHSEVLNLTRPRCARIILRVLLRLEIGDIGRDDNVTVVTPRTHEIGQWPPPLPVHAARRPFYSNKNFKDEKHE